MPNHSAITEFDGSVDRSVPVRFGAYTLDRAQRILFHFGKEIHLKPKTFEVFEYLVERANRVVPKDEILDAVWDDAFVEESNLTVHISALRKILATDISTSISIDTIPKIGYRFRFESNGSGGTLTEVNGDKQGQTAPRLVVPSDRINAESETFWTPSVLRLSVVGTLIVILAAASGGYFFGGELIGFSPHSIETPAESVKPHSFESMSCPRDTGRSNLENGGCDDSVSSFSILANPNGNWSYGYSQLDSPTSFVPFEYSDKNNHFGSPEVPVEIWRRKEEWHPLILRNTSPLTIVIQGGVVLPPNMVEMHPGRDGERSVLRWTAPAAGHFRLQGQFRGLNTNELPSCRTSTDALIIYNSNDFKYSKEITGYDTESRFDLTIKATEHNTVDFSVGYGSNKGYECDSTGFSVIITTISLDRFDEK